MNRGSEYSVAEIVQYSPKESGLVLVVVRERMVCKGFALQFRHEEWEQLLVFLRQADQPAWNEPQNTWQPWGEGTIGFEYRKLEGHFLVARAGARTSYLVTTKELWLAFLDSLRSSAEARVTPA